MRIGYLIAAWTLGFFWFYPQTTYLDGEYTPSWESALCLIWFIWFPGKWIYYKIKDANYTK